MVSVAWMWSGTHLTDLLNFPASGKKIKSTGITHYFLNNFLITGHWQVVEKISILKQLKS